MKHLLLLLTLGASLGTLCAQTTLQDSLIAHYPFDGDALDVSGNGNHGTVFGATLTTDRNGNPNSAYAFDGVNDYISFTPNLDFHPQLSVSITAWVMLSDHQANLIFHNDYLTTTYQGFYVNTLNGNLSVGYGDGGVIAPTNRRSKGSNFLMAVNQWYHVAVVMRGPTDMDIYINGVNACGTYTGSGGPLSYTFQDGVSGIFDGNNYFHGVLDDIRFWSRALTDQEIASLQDVPPGLVNTDTTLCLGDTLQLYGGDAASYTWSANPSGSLSCASCPEPLAFPNIDTDYQLITNNGFGCTDTYQLTILVDSCSGGGGGIDTSFVDSSLTCEDLALQAVMVSVSTGQTVNLTDNSNGAVDSLVFDLGNGDIISGMPGQSYQYTYPQPGNYELCLRVYGFLPDTTCMDSVCVTVLATEGFACEGTGLTAAFNMTASGNVATFTDLSVGSADELDWSFGDGTSQNTQPGVIITHGYPGPSTYQVCLTAIDTLANGHICKSTDCQYLTIERDSSGGVDPTAINKGNPWGLRLAPNPGQAGFWLQQQKPRNMQLSVFDSRGRLVHRQSFDDERQFIGTRHWNEGIYLLRLSDGEQQHTLRWWKR